MTALAIVLAATSALVLAVWASRHVQIALHRRRSFVLSEDYVAGSPAAGAGERASGETPFVTVVVAAKDEEANIAACLRGLLEQDCGNFEVIAVDDRSRDRTGEIIEAAARENRRLRAIHVTELPPGWCGKNHAMQTGIAAARGEWLCMTDADCRQHSRKTLRAALAYARAGGADLLSVLPNLRMEGFWENVVQPVCSGIMMIWFHPDKVNDPARPHAYANGALMLMRRRAYERVGGHAAVRGEVNEDMHLAALVKSAGMHLRVVRNRGLYSVRMYTSLSGIVRGWGRIFYGTFGTLARLGASLAVLAVMGLLPYAAAALGATGWLAGAGAAPAACALVALGAVAMQISVVWRFYGLIGARKMLAWTYPLGCAVAAASLLVAISKLRRGSRLTWRDTTYDRAR